MNEYLQALEHQKAVKTVSNQSPGEILNPLEGIARTQAVMLNVSPTPENLESISDALSDGLDVEKLLLTQAVNLQNLSSHFWNKSLVGFSTPEVLRSLPEMPSEFAAIALRCASESRKYLQLLNEVRNPKRATFIKNQENTLIVDQSPQLLEESKLYALDRGNEGEAETDDYVYPALAEINRASDTRRETQDRTKRTQTRSEKCGNKRSRKTSG